MRKLTTEEFIRRARVVHGDKYMYDEVVYVDMFTHVKIRCPIHGIFEQSPTNHLKGNGCPSCSNKKKHNTEEFIQLATMKHGDAFDYSESVYINATTKVLIRCKRCGEVFKQSPANHLHGRGCPYCCRKNRALFGLRKEKYGIGINDYSGSTKGLRSYLVWEKMLLRCYDETLRWKYPTYKDCSVCEEWRYFSNFKKWFDENYIDGYSLDKDILIQGNKIYSPQTCCFVPQQINAMITKSSAIRGNLPIGVVRGKKGFIARMSINKKQFTIGHYDTPEEAFRAYKEVKEKHIKDVAQEYYNQGLISKDVRNALLNYKINITD